MSTLQDTSVAGQFTTDAEFRSWASDIAALLDAAGWLKTADTGQINLATVTKPASSGTFAGYEIRKLNDSLVTSAPVFMKVEYGAFTSGTTPSLRYTFGTGSNGSGTLTGTGLASTITTSTTGSATTGVGYACAAQGFAGFYSGRSGTTSGNLGLSVERFRDSDGTPNGNGIQIVYLGASTLTEQTIDYTLSASRSARTGVPAIVTMDSTGVEGTDTAVWPVQTVHRKQHPHSLGLMVVSIADVGWGVTFSVTRYGASHTYVNVTPSGTSIAAGGPSNNGLAMLYE